MAEQPAGAAAYDDRRERLGYVLGTALGAVSLVGGLAWIMLNLHWPPPVADVTAGTLLALGGLVLLMPHRIALPARRAGLVATATAIAGTAAGLISSSAHLCCMWAYVEERGFPFRWLGRGATADDPDVAQTLAVQAGWHVEVPALAADLVVWAYLGILIVAVGTIRRRTR